MILLDLGRTINVTDVEGDHPVALSQFPIPTQASIDSKDGDGSTPQGIVSREQVAKLLNNVPTFTIVDQAGVPFMVVGEDAKVTAYFFVSYSEAARLLKLATVSADQSIEATRKGEEMDAEQQVNPWKKARISTVPMDTALSIALQSSGGALRSYFQVAATEADIEDALAATGKVDLAEGKVPLFYYSDFQDSNGKSPLYFSKNQLESAFRQSSARGEPLPQLQVTELLSVVRLMVQPGSDESVASLVFVPPLESAKRAKECIRKGGSDPPLVMGKRNIVL